MARALVLIAACLCFSILPGAAYPATEKAPVWSELTLGQRTILAPLAQEWDALEAARKKKWIGIANRYRGMSATDQEKVQRRMRDWAKLSQEERRAARDGYRNLSKLPPEKQRELREKWEEYRQLPEDEREQLRAQGKALKAPAAPATRKASGQRSKQNRDKVAGEHDTAR